MAARARDMEVAPRLLARVHQLATAPDQWRRLVPATWSGRWYVPLPVERGLEAWLIGWPTGEAIDLHDHGQSSGAFAVVEGALLETYLDPARGGAVRRRQWFEGEAVAFGPEHVHDVVNPHPGHALSVHVYSPPLSTMNFYPPPVDDSRALHPAGRRPVGLGCA